MFKSVKITVNNCEISCYDIFLHMLKFGEIPLIGEQASDVNPHHFDFEGLEVTIPFPFAFFGLFIPIMKWTNLAIFEINTF